jgi:hypothetical protein
VRSFDDARPASSLVRASSTVACATWIRRLAASRSCSAESTAKKLDATSNASALRISPDAFSCASRFRVALRATGRARTSKMSVSTVSVPESASIACTMISSSSTVRVTSWERRV